MVAPNLRGEAIQCLISPENPHRNVRSSLQEAGVRKDIGWHIIEKDFWVCWLLRLIFADPENSG